VFAEPIVETLYSSRFNESALLIQVLCIGVFIRCASKVFVAYLLGMNRPGVASISVLVGIIVNIVLYMILLPILGIVGAAISMTISYFCSSILLFLYFKSISSMNLKKILFFQHADMEFVKRCLSDFVFKSVKQIGLAEK
jgi:O-antigen/teichoic acid export membrane protein